MPPRRHSLKLKGGPSSRLKLKEVEEKVEEEKVEGEKVEEKVEEIFARWRSSTEAIMAMLNSEDLPDQNREEERQMQEKNRQNAKQVEAKKKATALQMTSRAE